ncbi:MAG: 23S rRNA (adenine(2503)-C(2))-methyltransferase RlmN [Oscillospiraceae bacterium]|nr:23S rRNA (adenine(2503)-C(2))-methyltransferase RlmN [Oscillospiraceae bacterium]
MYEGISEYNDKIDIKSLELDELKNLFVSWDLPQFRAAQIYKWLHQKSAESFYDMSDIPVDLRNVLDEKCCIKTVKIKRKLVSSIDNTVKYLYEMPDGECVEAALMQYKYGKSLCISTQAGCRMGCRFCASTLMGLSRNLLASEMLDEVYCAQKDCKEKISHLVLMGTGEPLDNFDNVIKFLKILTSEEGQNLGMRHISLSTCGLVDKIRELMKLKLQLTLSISLHAYNDETRKKIMPIANKWSIDELISVCKDYFEYTGRRISFEYALINEVNDSPEDAENLSKLLKGMNGHVNLIPLNPVKEREFKRGNQERIKKFLNILLKNGLNATIRRELGSDINAACGQLRRENSTQEA